MKAVTSSKTAQRSLDAALKEKIPLTTEPITTSLKKAKEILQDINSKLPESRKRSPHLDNKLSERTLNYIEFMKKHATSATQLELKEMRKQRKRFIFEDYRNWLTKILEQTERQLSKHDTRAAYRTIKQITQKQRQKGTKKLTSVSIQSTTERLSEWLRYHTDFQQTQHENYESETGKWPTINTGIPRPPLNSTNSTEPTLQELNNALSSLPNNRATGPDEIPIEIYKASPHLQLLLHKQITHF